MESAIKYVGRLMPLRMKIAVSSFYARYLKPLPKYSRLNKFSGVSCKRHDTEVIVSLTSYPARIGTVHQTIITILNQLYRPDRVVLWLAESQFPEKEAELPLRLIELVKYGLEIRWTEDFRSYKKLIPTLKEFPEAIIVTCDDDTFYPGNWLLELMVAHDNNPGCVCSHRAHTIRFDSDGRVSPFLKWDFESTSTACSYRNFATGIGGILYPPHCLAPQVNDDNLFMDIAPTCDDHWFWAMAVLNRTRICIVPNGMRHCYENPRASKAFSLCKLNTGADYMSNDDVVFKKLYAMYPELKERLCE